MNKTYRLIWNDVRQSWTVTHEAASSRGKPASKAKPLAAVLAGALLMHGGLAQAVDPTTLPTGGQVVSGQASISQSGSAMTINQGSDQAILNWNSFSIGSGASVEFLQPSSSSVALNRVIGTDPSGIYGSLTANGQVFLINPNGVLFGQGARVDVGGLVASTLNVRDEDFLAGNYRFSRDGATGSVVNQGELYGKYIALLAPEVLNEGVIAAHQGTVVLAAGDAVTLNITGNRLIDVAVDQASLDTLVENRHLIQADDGMVIMSAQSANGLIGRVVNSDAVEAQGIVNDGGVVRLLASSTVEHSGTINADGGTSGNGGEVILLASLSNPDSLTDVSGTLSARGGSDAGDGGFVETSAAHVKIHDTARIDTRAPKGSNGQWLIDPIDYTVAAVGGDITGATLSANLELGDVTINTAGVGGNGDIFINDTVNWVSGSTLYLEADRNIEINASMSFGDFFGFPLLQITYGMGGSGMAVIKQGVNWSGAGAGSIFDNTNFQITAPGAEDTSRDFYIGTKGVDIYVQLISGTGVYGDTNLTWDYCADAACATPININSAFGSVTWDVPFSNLTVDGAGPTYSLSYVSGLSSDYYTGFAAGPAANWTVTPATLTYTANAATMAEGGAVPALSGSVTGFVYADTQASATSGSLTFTTTADSTSTPGDYAIDGSGLSAANYTFVQAAGNATALTVTAAAGGTPPPTGGTTTPSDSGNLLDIITKSLLKQKNDGGAFSKTIAETLLTKKGKGIETQEKNDALEFIRLAVKEQCGEQCSVNEETILEWLGGVKASPTATLAGSIVYKEVPIRQFAFGTALHDLSDGKADGGYDSDKAKAILKRAGQRTESSSEKPDFSDISDDDVNYFFNAARRTDSWTPQSEIVAYLNKYSNKGGTRSFWLEGDRIVSGPSAPEPITRAKEPHYDISAKTNLKPGTRVTVSLKDDSGKTQSRKATVDGQGNVKIEGKVGDMKLPLTVSMSSEKPKYESDSITVGTAPQPVVEQTKVKLSSSMTDEVVSANGNRQPQIDERDFLSMNAHIFSTLGRGWTSSSNVATAKVQEAVGVALNKAREPDSGLDFHPDAVAYADKIAPDLSDLSDYDLDMFFYGANQREVAGDWPKSAVIAYLNKTANNGGTRTFRLEDGRIVSTPEKAPHYHVTAETNLQPGTAVTVSIKDANGTTKTTKAVVGEKGEVKVDGAVGEMKQPLQIDISSEQPEYRSKPITVFTMRSKAEEAFEKLNAGQRGELIQLLYENRYNAENSGNTENPEAEALKKLLGTLSGKDDPAYDGAKTALKEALESPNADEKALFEVLTNLPRRPENPLRGKFAKLDVAQQMWIKSALRFAAGTTETAADALKALLSASNEKGDPAYDGAKAALKEVLESPNADEKKLFEVLMDLRDSL